jgi:hypothetical protein
MNWFEKLKKLFKRKENRKEQIIAVKPTEFSSSNSIKILHCSSKYIGFGHYYDDGYNYCCIITYPHFPPCDITLNITNTDYNFILIGTFINYMLTDNDGIRSWWNLPIIQLIKTNEENYDIQYSYDLLKKIFNENIEILKYQEK